MLAAVDVDEHFRAGVAAWPEIVVAPERFASEVERRGTALETLKGADLYVAIACVDGIAPAIEAVRAMLASEVRFAGTKTTASREQLEDVTAQLSRVLFIDEPERPAALRAYSGRGGLKAYLRVIAMRELVRVVNRGRREVAIGEDDFIDRIVPASDPEISILRRQYHDVVDDAMRAALQTLDERERALLRYAFVDGLHSRAPGGPFCRAPTGPPPRDGSRPRARVLAIRSANSSPRA